MAVANTVCWAVMAVLKYLALKGKSLSREQAALRIKVNRA